jgi:hypothetical protein
LVVETLWGGGVSGPGDLTIRAVTAVRAAAPVERR